MVKCGTSTKGWALETVEGLQSNWSIWSSPWTEDQGCHSHQQAWFHYYEFQEGQHYIEELAYWSPTAKYTKLASEIGKREPHNHKHHADWHAFQSVMSNLWHQISNSCSIRWGRQCLMPDTLERFQYCLVCNLRQDVMKTAPYRYCTKLFTLTDSRKQ